MLFVTSAITLTNEMVFSAIIVSLIYILITLAICFGEFSDKRDENFKLVWLMEPVFKKYSIFILSTISIVLCIGTLILFVGGVARLVSSLNLTTYITLTLVYLNYLSLDNLVAFADGFFISNAIIAIY
jgi:APA family basic amino acid/polyamine antiporter